jgi:hypothetical protein
MFGAIDQGLMMSDNIVAKKTFNIPYFRFFMLGRSLGFQ